MTTTTPTPHYVSQGEGLPVVLLHGMGLDHRGLMMLDDAFGEGTRRIYIDLPGHGRTDALPVPGGLQEMADWTLNAVNEIVGDEPFALVGNSMGGAFARYIVAKESAKVKGMALIASVVDPVRSHRHVAEHVVSDPNPALTERVAQSQIMEFLQMGVNQSFEAWRRYQRYVLPGTRLYDKDAGARLNKRYWLDAVPEDSLRTPYAGPVLIACGAQDQVVGFEDHKSLLPHYSNATYEVIDPSGHNIFIDAPEVLKPLLAQWSASILNSYK